MSVDDVGSLNRLEVRRFAATAIEAYGGDVNRQNAESWRVTLPPSLSNLAETRDVAVVFDPKDQQPGRDEILVQPGSLAFNQLLDLVKEDTTVGQLYLTAADMQVVLPDVLDISELSVSIEEFDPQQTADAVSFHFLVEMESVSSFHRERFETVSLDLANGNHQLTLSERLRTHTSTLTGTHETASVDPDDDVIEQRYAAAVDEIEHRIEEDAAELLDEATSAAETRADEISDLYDQRKEELDDELGKLAASRREDALDEREQNEIKETVERHNVDVNISLVGMTLISHDVGDLSISIDDGERTGEATVGYAPATGEVLRFNCATCETQFDDQTRPQVCECGSIICAGCLSVCEECGSTGCPNCETPVATCELCGRVECHQCGSVCGECGRAVCNNHIASSSSTDRPTCLACGEGCASCGTFYADPQLSRCRVDGDLHCKTHTGSCETCSDTLCQSHLGSCTACGIRICPDDRVTCETCEGLFCESHRNVCATDGESHCDSHLSACSTCGDALCKDHVKTCAHCGDLLCADDATVCATCGESHCSDHIEMCLGSIDPHCVYSLRCLCGVRTHVRSGASFGMLQLWRIGLSD